MLVTIVYYFKLVYTRTVDWRLSTFCYGFYYFMLIRTIRYVHVQTESLFWLRVKQWGICTQLSQIHMYVWKISCFWRYSCWKDYIRFVQVAYVWRKNERVVIIHGNIFNQFVSENCSFYEISVYIHFVSTHFSKKLIFVLNWKKFRVIINTLFPKYKLWPLF